MSEQRLNPVNLAISMFTQIRNEIGEDETLGSKLRHRAREGPELIKSLGLIPTLSFYYAKARDAMVGKGDKESKAYALYLEAVLLYLEEVKIVKGIRDIFSQKPAEGSEKEIHEKMVNTLKDISGKSYIAAKLLKPFLIEFKRLCEAVWERER